MGRAVPGLVLVLALAGCGGGGGRPSSAPSDTGTVTRQMRPGDSATYSATGSLATLGGSIPITGTLRYAVSAGTEIARYGSRSIVVSTELTLDSSAGRSFDSWQEIIEQDAAGNVYQTGRSRWGHMTRLESVEGLPMLCPGQWRVGGAWDYTATYDPGFPEQHSSRVIALEAVDGQNAYRVRRGSSGGYNSTYGDEWFVPDWGIPIKIDASVVVTGGRAAIAAILTSKHLAPTVDDLVGPTLTDVTLIPPTSPGSNVLTIAVSATDISGVRAVQAVVTSPRGIVERTESLVNTGGPRYTGWCLCPTSGSTSARTYTVLLVATDSLGNQSQTPPQSFAVPLAGTAPPPQ